VNSSPKIWFTDYVAFVSLFGAIAEINRLITVEAPRGMPLHLGWVHGDE
jgi:hypothetical protein